MPELLLEVSDVAVDYLTDAGAVRAVDGVSFDVGAGEFLGIVGESGCGKSTLLFGVAQLLSVPAELVAGTITFRGTDMVRLDRTELRHMRWRDYSVVLQSAMNALNPMKSIGAQFKDTLDAHGSLSAEEVRHRSAEVMELVGIDPIHLRSYPHQLSGGMRQRAMIAMALLFTPQLVIMDEPVTRVVEWSPSSWRSKPAGQQPAYASEQKLAQVVDQLTCLPPLVTSWEVELLKSQIAEAAPTETIFRRHLHPYTRGLLSAFPSISGPRRELLGIPGSPPDLARPPSGCRFHPRCPEVMPQCLTVEPELYQVGQDQVRCLLYVDEAQEAV